MASPRHDLTFRKRTLIRDEWSKEIIFFKIKPNAKMAYECAMIEQLNRPAKRPGRVVVIGARGFVGSSIVKQLTEKICNVHFKEGTLEIVYDLGGGNVYMTGPVSDIKEITLKI